MLTTVLRTAILMAAILAGCLQAGTLDDIRALEAGKTGRSAPAMDLLNLPENGAATTTDRDVQNTLLAWYSLSDNRKVKVQGRKVVLLIQSTRLHCRQFAPALKTFSQKTDFDVFPINLDGKGDAEFPDALLTMPDVMVGYSQSDLLVVTPAAFLTNVNAMETWPLLQDVTKADEFRSRLSEVLRMALDRQSGKSTPLNTQRQQ